MVQENAETGKDSFPWDRYAQYKNTKTQYRLMPMMWMRKASGTRLSEKNML